MRPQSAHCVVLLGCESYERPSRFEETVAGLLSRIPIRFQSLAPSVGFNELSDAV